MERTIARLNIEHYKRLLETETDAAKRQTILRLLAEEETKLADHENKNNKNNKDNKDHKTNKENKQGA